jgi:hypothetical protein
MQGEWIINCVKYMLDNGYSRIEADREAEKSWRNLVHDINDKSLFPLAKSWYMGANIPGKRVEPLNFTGGVPLYYKRINDVADKKYEGFHFSKAPGRDLEGQLEDLSIQ